MTKMIVHDSNIFLKLINTNHPCTSYGLQVFHDINIAKAAFSWHHKWSDICI